MAQNQHWLSHPDQQCWSQQQQQQLQRQHQLQQVQFQSQHPQQDANLYGARGQHSQWLEQQRGTNLAISTSNCTACSHGPAQTQQLQGSQVGVLQSSSVWLKQSAASWQQEQQHRLEQGRPRLSGTGGGKEVPGFVVQDIVSAGDLFTTVVTIPNERCALVIGRQERTLKSLQEQSGTHMAIMPQKGLLPHRRLSVRSASTVCVEFATLLIRDIVEGNRTVIGALKVKRPAGVQDAIDANKAAPSNVPPKASSTIVDQKPPSAKPGSTTRGSQATSKNGRDASIPNKTTRYLRQSRDGPRQSHRRYDDESTSDGRQDSRRISSPSAQTRNAVPITERLSRPPDSHQAARPAKVRRLSNPMPTPIKAGSSPVKGVPSPNTHLASPNTHLASPNKHLASPNKLRTSPSNPAPPPKGSVTSMKTSAVSVDKLMTSMPTRDVAKDIGAQDDAVVPRSGSSTDNVQPTHAAVPGDVVKAIEHTDGNSRSALYTTLEDEGLEKLRRESVAALETLQRQLEKSHQREIKLLTAAAAVLGGDNGQLRNLLQVSLADNTKKLKSAFLRVLADARAKAQNEFVLASEANQKE